MFLIHLRISTEIDGRVADLLAYFTWVFVGVDLCPCVIILVLEDVLRRHECLLRAAVVCALYQIEITAYDFDDNILDHRLEHSIVESAV